MKALTMQDIQPGKSFRVFFSKGNYNNKTIHIRAIVDKHIVFCVWSAQKGYRWQIESNYLFELYLRDGYLKRARAKFPAPADNK